MFNSKKLNIEIVLFKIVPNFSKMKILKKIKV